MLLCPGESGCKIKQDEKCDTVKVEEDFSAPTSPQADEADNRQSCSTNEQPEPIKNNSLKQKGGRARQARIGTQWVPHTCVHVWDCSADGYTRRVPRNSAGTGWPTRPSFGLSGTAGGRGKPWVAVAEVNPGCPTRACTCGNELCRPGGSEGELLRKAVVQHHPTSLVIGILPKAAPAPQLGARH